MKFYIKDTTKNEILYFNDIKEVITNLERICLKLKRQNRSTFMTEMVSLGHGYDDSDGIYFTQLMGDIVETGLVKYDGKLLRCNIHEVIRNNKYRDVTGD